MGWFGSKKKRVSPYLTDTGDWRFASLYKHDIDLAIAKFDRSHLFELRKDEIVGRPLGDWEARGLVHFDFGGPLIPFELSIGGHAYRDEEDARLGQFHVTRIQPYSNPQYPEDAKPSYLRIGAHIDDPTGEIAATVERAMHQAAISRKQFLHVRLGKDASDPDAAAAQVQEKKYSDSIPILRFVVGECIQLAAPAAALAWEDL